MMQSTVQKCAASDKSRVDNLTDFSKQKTPCRPNAPLLKCSQCDLKPCKGCNKNALNTPTLYISGISVDFFIYFFVIAT